MNKAKSTLAELESLACAYSSHSYRFHVFQYSARDRLILGLEQLGCRYGVFFYDSCSYPMIVGFFPNAKAVRHYFSLLDVGDYAKLHNVRKLHGGVKCEG